MSVDIKDTGELKKKSAFSLLYQSLCNGEDGVFVFASGREKFSVILQGNKLKTPQSIVDEATLGKYLFEKGTLNDESFMQVKKIQDEQKIPFFQAAIQTNAVTFDTIQIFVKDKMDEIFSKILSWNDGKYIVVGQIPKDIVQIEVSEPLFSYLFNRRMDYHKKANTGIPSDGLEFSERESLTLDDLKLSAPQLKIIQTLKKTKSTKNLDTFANVEMSEVTPFVRTLIDFQLITLEKARLDEKTKQKHYASFDFKNVYDNFESLSFYELLGLNKNISTGDVSPQYFEIAKDYHPDRFREKEGFEKAKIEKVFAKITEAYQTLSNSSAKQAYDDKLEGKVEKQVDVEKVVESEGIFLDGMDCLRRGQFDKAVACFKHAISLYEEEYEYHIRLAWAEYRLGLKSDDQNLIQKGKKGIAQALKGNRAKDDVLYYQGLIFKNDGEFEKAKTAFNRALGENKNHMQAGQELRAVQMLLEKRQTTSKKGWFKK